MMRDFVKYHSLGNDFVIVDWFKKPESYLQSITQSDGWSNWVQQVCKHHTGIGADGVLIIRGNTEAGVPEVLVYNADGSAGQTCLNGLRAVARYLVIHRRLPAHLSIKMGQRLYVCDVVQQHSEGVESLVTTAMHLAENEGTLTVTIGGESFEGMRMSVGNPHFVIARSVDRDFVQRVGPLIESHASFPNRTNVEFFWQDCLRDDLYHLLVYERGCGITNACSSGAAAAVSLLYERRVITDDVHINIAMPGGNLTCWISDGMLYMQAPAVEVFSGAFAQEAQIR